MITNYAILYIVKEETTLKQPFAYLSKEHAAYLKNLVQQAANIDKNCAVFGAKKHKYQLNPVVTLEEVKRFEQKYQIKLPSEYVFFITQVGNGGAGPDYGIYGIDTKNLPPLTETEIIPPTPHITPELTQPQWEMLIQAYADYEYDESNGISDGTYCIGTKGCTYFNYVISSGDYENLVYYFDANYEETSPPFVLSMHFLEWYAAYFSEIIQGNTTHCFGYLPLYTQEEVIAICQNQTDHQTQIEALQTLYRFPTLHKDTITFLKNCETPDMEVQKYKLLLQFEPEFIIKQFRHILQTKPEIAVSICRNIPNEYKDAYYTDMLDLLYHMDFADLAEKQIIILVFLERCQSFCAADILPFAKDETQPPRSRGFAFDQMCYAPDKRAFEKEYMEVLQHCDEPDVVKNVLTLSMLFHRNRWLAIYIFLREKFKRSYAVCWALDIRLRDYGFSKDYNHLTETFDDI